MLDKSAHGQIIIDTNILLYDLDCLNNFGNNTVIIITAVIDELDKVKNENSERGYASRQVTKKLMALGENGDLSTGVPLLDAQGNERGAVLILDETDVFTSYAEPKMQRPATVDDWVLTTARLLAQHTKGEVRMVTRDYNMILKAAGKVQAEMYFADSIAKKASYKGYRKITLTAEAYEHLCSVAEVDNTYGLYPNEFAIFSPEDMPKSTIIGIAKGNVIKRINIDTVNSKGLVLPAVSLEQKMLLYLLFDPDITAITVNGTAGKGKTLLSMEYALHEVKDGRFNQLMYAKSLTDVDAKEDISALPGNADMKLMPSVGPITDNLEVLAKSSKKARLTAPRKTAPNATASTAGLTIDEIVPNQEPGQLLLADLIAKGTIQLTPLNFLRGRSIVDKVLILDEGQNVSRHTMKTLITRIADTSKIIVTGDESQIDDLNLNEYNNGMAHLIEQGKPESMIAHITLDLDGKSQRGLLAAFGSNKL